MAKLTGVVEAVNKKGTGVLIDGKWRNYSKRMSQEPISWEQKGKTVVLDLDSEGVWIQSWALSNGEGAPPAPAAGGSTPGSHPAGGSPPHSNRDNEIMAQVALKCAAEIMARRVARDTGEWDTEKVANDTIFLASRFYLKYLKNLKDFV